MQLSAINMPRFWIHHPINFLGFFESLAALRKLAVQGTSLI